MRYLSLDIETTGLEASRSDIVEIGIVADAWDDSKFNNLANPYVFHAYVDTSHNDFVPWNHGDDEAKQIHKDSGMFYKWREAELLTEVTERCVGGKIAARHLAWRVSQWISLIEFTQPEDKGRVNLGGKNAAYFDIPFLQQTIPDWKRTIRNRSRVLDPGILYALPSDQYVPSLNTCLDRAGMPSKVNHTALEDALQVRDLLRNHFC